MQRKRILGKRRFTLQTRIILLVCSVVVLSLLVTDLLITGQTSKDVEGNLAEKATDVARMVASTSLVKEALTEQGKQEELQAFANEIKRKTNVEFVVVMDMKGIRKTHPVPDKVGKRFVGGDEGPVLHGIESVSVAKGTLGLSLRSFTPVFDNSGKQIGAVAVGISLKKVNQAIAESRKIIYLAVGFGLLVGIIGALVLARKIKGILLGLEPNEIAKVLEERSAMLESVREGMVAVDADGFITLVNQEGIRLFQKGGLHEPPIGNRLDEYLPNAKISAVLRSGIPEVDVELDLNGVTILANKVPVVVNGKTVGAILTFRDKTEIKLLADQLAGTKLYAEALRAQTHEFMNKLHAIAGLIDIGDQQMLSAYIAKILNHQQTEVGFVASRFKDPILAGFLLGKLSFARESGVELSISGDGILPEPADQETVHEVITILGNLIDNALEAVADTPTKNVSVRFDYFENLLNVEVHDSGKGIEEVLRRHVFLKGFSTKGENRGYGLFLVMQSLEKIKGEIEVHSQKGKGTTFIVSIPYLGRDESSAI
ncbi:DcuS/MalK family sensor histidine kinase [Neobacillus sp. SM06]|uniref:DcuS/MalK family sensor histidine kinase n=1 Tax=Neobacillus sp. SM06 TaxID=3422492 RepID=UPI003D29B32D